jgi:hypothetical protein
MAVADDAFSVQQKSFGCTIYTKINTELSLGIGDVDKVRIAQTIQPAQRLIPFVLIVDAVNCDTLLFQSIEKLMFGSTGWTPGCPDIE